MDVSLSGSPSESNTGRNAKRVLHIGVGAEIRAPIQAQPEVVANPPGGTEADANGVFVEPGSAISVAGLLDRAEAGIVPQGSKVVLTVTGHGLKDPQWALRNADGSAVEPTVVDATTSEVAAVLDLA